MFFKGLKNEDAGIRDGSRKDSLQFDNQMDTGWST